MSEVPERIKKQLLDYPFVTAVGSPQATKIAPKTTKTTKKSLNTGVRA